MKLSHILFFPVFLASEAFAEVYELSSPDEKLQIQVHAENEQVAYSVTFNGEPIIGKSRLGVVLNEDAFSGGIVVDSPKRKSHYEEWSPVWGQSSSYRDHHQELSLQITEVAELKRKMEVVLRAYNDGMAFRYRFPQQEGMKQADFKKELSEVALISEAPVAWYPKLSTHVSKEVPFQKLGRPCRTPFTARLGEDCFVSLHEAAAVNSSDANLVPAKDKRTLRYQSNCKQGTGTKSPWRTIQISSTPAGLVESPLLLNLNEPNKPTGLSRSYPHWMSRKYVNSMLDGPNRPSATPSELCIFPVVHNLAGPVDRSCGLFDMEQSIRRAKVQKQIPSTVVSQVAQCLVFLSGILTLPDMPDAYRRKLDLFEFIKGLPMTYDETRVLELEIGRNITMARRSVDTWFVAALVDEKGREVELELDFLKPNVTYDVQVFEDTAESHYQFSGSWNNADASKKKMPFKPVESNRELYQVRSLQAKQGDKHWAKLAPGGGRCLIFKPTVAQ